MKRARPMKVTHAIALVLAAAAGGACTPGPVDVATVAPNSLATGLVAHWTFDETAGATALDGSGNGRDGAIIGPTWSRLDGQFGGALQFAGMDQVTVGGGFGFPQPTANYSVSAWLRVTVGDPASPIEALLSTEIPWGAGPPGGWSLNVDLAPPGSNEQGNYHFTYWFGQGGPSEFVTAQCVCVVSDAWVHLAAVVDAEKAILTFFVGGQARDQVPIPRGIWPAPGSLFMGRWPLPGPGLTTHTLSGALDDVAIYARALVPEEVIQLSRAPAPDPI
jgi:hypothetical protein